MRRPLRGVPGAHGTAMALLASALLLPFAAPSPAGAQVARPTCESCHGELELLRQHVPTLEDARALLAPASVVASSAHATMTCTDCHDGFRSYPHDTDATRTRSCASCHESQAGDWRGGMHALDSAAQCMDCHGTHDVLPAAVLHTPEGARAMRKACTSCHYEPGMPMSDPHADSVSCAGCHEPHRTLPSEDERSTTNVLNQARTCGTCHDTIAAAWRRDVHGTAVPLMALPGGRVPEGATSSDPPACTGCHGAHGMLRPSDPDFGERMVERCAHCHEPYAESFADSYHGQASTLGSPIVATCHDCHGAHGIYPASDPRSLVSDEKRLSTCQRCHEGATASFALFQPHADHNDRQRYPYVYWSYHLMTALLIGVFLVFGAHTLLWLVRLGVDAIRGTSHGAHTDVGG